MSFFFFSHSLMIIFQFSPFALSNNSTPSDSCVIITMNSLFILILCFIVITLLLPPTVFSYLLLVILDFLEHKLSMKVHCLTICICQGGQLRVPKNYRRPLFFLRVACGTLNCLWFSITCAILLSITIANWVGSKSLEIKRLYNEEWRAGGFISCNLAKMLYRRNLIRSQ